VFLGFAGASHFRGAIVQWHPVDPQNFDGRVRVNYIILYKFCLHFSQVVFTHRIAWRRSALNIQCERSHFGTSTLFNDGVDTLRCLMGCTGVAADLSFHCTDFSILEDWVTGERSSVFNIGTTVDFEAS
jgi:hypothetical protein